MYQLVKIGQQIMYTQYHIVYLLTTYIEIIWILHRSNNLYRDNTVTCVDTS